MEVVNDILAVNKNDMKEKKDKFFEKMFEYIIHQTMKSS